LTFYRKVRKELRKVRKAYIQLCGLLWFLNIAEAKKLGALCVKITLHTLFFRIFFASKVKS